MVGAETPVQEYRSVLIGAVVAVGRSQGGRRHTTATMWGPPTPPQALLTQFLPPTSRPLQLTILLLLQATIQPPSQLQLLMICHIPPALRANKPFTAHPDTRLASLIATTTSRLDMIIQHQTILQNCQGYRALLCPILESMDNCLLNTEGEIGLPQRTGLSQPLPIQLPILLQHTHHRQHLLQVTDPLQHIPLHGLPMLRRRKDHLTLSPLFNQRRIPQRPGGRIILRLHQVQPTHQPDTSQFSSRRLRNNQRVDQILSNRGTTTQSLTTLWSCQREIATEHPVTRQQDRQVGLPIPHLRLLNPLHTRQQLQGHLTRHPVISLPINPLLLVLSISNQLLQG